MRVPAAPPSAPVAEDLDQVVRLEIYRAFVEVGCAPEAAELACALDEPLAAIEAALRRLAAARALVLIPGTSRIWMAMPFSAVPTGCRVHSGARSWDANCAWDALGIPTKLKADAEITAQCPDCGASQVLRVQRGVLVEASGGIHFALPVVRWWEDIGFT